MKQAKQKITEEQETKSVNEQGEEYNPEYEPEILERLLKMADGYSAANSPHQATEIYMELAEMHADTPEARLAKQRLIAIGVEYEEQGNLHLARYIYERIMTLPMSF